jgi:5,10-methylenetetrahydromethanopterin reductase
VPYTLGAMAPPNLPVSTYVDFIVEAERNGFDEVWIAEDCFLKGGIAQAAVALATTQRIRVGVGILPTRARNVAFAALELAFLANVYPGRVIVGIGHGMTDWMRQVGGRVDSPLTLLAEYLQALRALLAGEEVTVDGRYVHLDKVRLDEPPMFVPPVLAGVRGPRSLAVAGRVADGTILAEPVTPEYLSAARKHISATGAHTIVAYNVAAVDDDAEVARRQVRPALWVVGEPAWFVHIAPLAFADELVALRRLERDTQSFVARLPDAWVNQLAIVGTPEQGRVRLAELNEAGADHLVVTPVGENPIAALQRLGSLRTSPLG